MEIPKLLVLLSCIYHVIASHSHQSYNIPVEGYDSELQDLGQHIEIPETPVKVIKITKTIAVKVPVPYPVKVREKVPYPVHVAKPYPVPVPQIIKVPHIVTTKSSGHKPQGSSDGGGGFQNTHQSAGQEGGGYEVQEGFNEPSSGEHSFGSDGQSLGGANSGHGQNFGDDYSYEGSPGSSYGAPASSYQVYSGNFGGAGQDGDKSQSYVQSNQDYFGQQKSSGNLDGANGGDNYHYH